MNIDENLEQIPEDISYWFVGAAYNSTDDQTDRFINEGIWENGYENKYAVEVNSIQIGDRIAIKSTYTRSKDLPFNYSGGRVSVMAIKAIGTVTKNLKDGRHLEVKWLPQKPIREWYFFTYLKTISKVVPSKSWKKAALVDFAFEGVDQDFLRFQDHAPNSSIAEDLKEILDENAESTTIETLVNARVGQGEFREEVLGLWDSKCAVTNSETLEAIRASHIKAWCESDDSERLDQYNGLPLVATLDALFDRGLIAFDADGNMLFSQQLSTDEKKRLQLEGLQLTKKPHARTEKFLQIHRDKFGF